MIEVGQRLPEVLGKDQDGNEIKLSDFAGKKLVLYVYPKDNTPGCTNQACNIRDNYSALLREGYAILGASIQSEASHKKFIEKYSCRYRKSACRATWRLWRKEDVWQSRYGHIPHHIYYRREWRCDSHNRS